MRFVSASVERIPIPDCHDRTTAYKHLERIGRLCYKSEDKITDDSCVRFIRNMHDRKHWAMLEHYPFVVTDDGRLYEALHSMYNDGPYYVQEKLHYIKQNVVDIPDRDGLTSMISGSATGFNYLLEACLRWLKEVSPDGDCHEEDIPSMSDFFDFMDYMHCRFSLLFNKPYPEECIDDLTFNKLDNNYRLWSQDELMKIEDPAVNMHLYMTARFITDRGVTHEIVRHRPASYAQESTRYCDYGKGGCQFIIPCWFSEDAKQCLLDYEKNPFIINGRDSIIDPFKSSEWCWIMAMLNDENIYNKLRGFEWSPQWSRSVLPNSVKTEIIATTNIPEWDHFFHMRVPKTAHPQMREVAIPLYRDSRSVYGDRLTNYDKEAEE